MLVMGAGIILIFTSLPHLPESARWMRGLGTLLALGLLNPTNVGKKTSCCHQGSNPIVFQWALGSRRIVVSMAF